ncbi:glucosamine-6-phosphate deaminase [Mesobacillus zeae]|uniref:Glucosamine-6-phosphate deaminase n=1 Tax=Mesobacillus zeae TaxID=1917180 RepID=A0A398B8K2_9BACI|nr:glucosamine-6-phosphate deaminase [Mesobacillus zeae]RID86305.1 glucosamine-6-phosphate deaminase [Mesobacillus zeae]
MNIIRVENYEEMSKEAAGYILKKLRENPRITLGLATGGTPTGTYQHLIEDHLKNGTSYKDVSTVNLDEYIGLNPDHPNSYRFYMNDALFNHIDIPLEQTYVPQGNAVDCQEECERYEKLIKNLGGIDLQLLGIGSNGHIGFNEPGTEFGSRTHIIDLEPSTREANARFFASLEEVPEKAITMGIASIMKSREILLLISGASKKEAMVQLLHGEVTEKFPASILQLHPNVTIIADEEALGLEADSRD